MEEEEEKEREIGDIMRGKDRDGHRGTREVLTGGRGRKRKSEKGRG